MNIFAELKSEFQGSLLHRGEITVNIINELDVCELSFQGIEFTNKKMIVQVALFDVGDLDAPRHEEDAEAVVRRELDKTSLDCSVRICHGTDYVDEEKRYEPTMTIQSQLRHGE